MLQRDIGRPTHTGIDSKLMTVGSRGLHHGVGQEIYFFDTHFHTLGPGGPPCEEARLEHVKKVKIADFPLTSSYISETIEDRHIVTMEN